MDVFVVAGTLWLVYRQTHRLDYTLGAFIGLGLLTSSKGDGLGPNFMYPDNW